MDKVNFYPWRKKQKRLQTQRWLMLSLFYLCPIMVASIYLFLAVTELARAKENQAQCWEAHLTDLRSEQQRLKQQRLAKQNALQKQQRWQAHLTSRHQALMRLRTIFTELPNETGFVDIHATKEALYLSGKTLAYPSFINYLEILKESKIAPYLHLDYLKQEENGFYAFSFSVLNEEEK